jgi:predicted Zn-dependent peptidase
VMTEQSLDRIHTDLINHWARSRIVPENATLIVAGKFDPELVKRHVAYDADQVSAGERTPAIAATPEPESERVSGIETKPSPTIELDLAFLGGRGIDAHHADRLVLEQVLANQLEQLRGIHALTYGFTATFAPRHAGGLWRISGDADATRAGEAATALLAILTDMRRDPETYRGAFVLARQQVLEQLVVKATSSATIVDHLAELARFDLPDDFYDHLANDVAALTLAKFHMFVRAELPAANQVFGAFGNADAVAAALAVARDHAGQ